MENGVDEKKINGFHKHDKGPMELYLIRISPPCRAVWLYLLQHEIPHILHDVDFSKHSTKIPEVFKSHSHQEVPLLVDGDIVVFEGQAILRYLAMKYTNYAGYGLSLQQQMLSESVISWCFSEVHRVIGYSYIYPQFLDYYSLKTTESNECLIEHGLRQVTKLLEVIENRYLMNNKYLTGPRTTIADTSVATVLVLLEWTNFNYKMWPKVEAWLTRVKQHHFWDEVHVTHTDFVKDIQRSSLIYD
ncbi:glutathione S-transferase [Mytilus galloprovincialis]|uniref:Glutathione S-transferase n=1 Tax=Mytilus galloprovincialis TaxID=29158 RepID=A0A8B6C5K3_MYTGA|nr:glutathione S-transferase [Mytilus galloprovincialis]